tara:strand:- start:2280 stop:3518 length:1239 start_codon:yes stop_codon:yes gene_type:complete
MAIPFLSNIDLNRNQALQLVLHNKTSDPSPAVEGQVYWNSSENKAYVYNGSAWINIGGDITRVNITAGDGLTGTVDTTGGEHTQTIDVVGGDGITANADEIEVTVDNSTLELSATDGNGVVQIKDNGVGLGKLAQVATGVVLGRSTTGTGNVEAVTPANFRGFLKNALNGNLAGVTFGDSNDTITIPGTLIVTGDTKYHNETIQIVEDNTLAFRAGDGNDHEILLTAADADSDKTITLPNLTGHVALLENAATELIDATPAELNILDGATITTAEINVLDGDTSATSTTVADADRFVMNDAGTMKQVAASDVATYIETQIAAREKAVNAPSTAKTANTAFTVQHDLGTEDVMVQVYNRVTNIDGDGGGTNEIDNQFETVNVEVWRNSNAQITIKSGVALAANSLRVLITKIG